MITVIIPTYNRANYLRQAIESVLHQTFRDFEIIVVDDASTDNTKEVVLAYEDKVRYIFQDNKERAAARNNGIKNAKGDYVAFLDSDDLWQPEHLEVCFEALKKNPGAGLAFSGSYMIDEEGKIFSKMKLSDFNDYVLSDIVSKFSSGGCNASSCLIKKDIFDKTGYFNEDRKLSGSEDWEMWVRIADSAEFIQTNKYTAMIRFHQNKSSINADSMAKSMTLAMDIVYGNPNLLPKIRSFKKNAYSSLRTIIAINYYSSGDMAAARRYLKQALINYPLSLFVNKYIIWTFLRSLLGHRLSSCIRKMKYGISNFCHEGTKARRFIKL